MAGVDQLGSRLHEPGLVSNPGQDARPGQPFSSQMSVTVNKNNIIYIVLLQSSSQPFTKYDKS